MSKLYHLPYSKTIDGFHQSEVFVVARNMNEAKDRLRAVVSLWMLDPYGAFRLHYTVSGVDSKEFYDNYHAKMAELEAEIDNLTMIEGVGLVRCKI